MIRGSVAKPKVRSRFLCSSRNHASNSIGARSDSASGVQDVSFSFRRFCVTTLLAGCLIATNLADAQQAFPIQSTPQQPRTQRPASLDAVNPSATVESLANDLLPPESDEKSTVQPAAAETQQLTIADVEELQKSLNDATDLEDEERQRIAEIYRVAAQHLQRSGAFTAQKGEYEQQLADANGRAEELDQRLKQPLAEITPPNADVPLPKLEQQLAEYEQRLKDLRDRFNQADQAINARSDRRKSIRDRLALATSDLEAIPGRLAEAGLSKNALSTTATETEVKAQQLMLRAEVPALESELKLLDAEDALDLPRLERERLAREVKHFESGLTQLQSYVQERRAEDAIEQTKDARQVAERESNPLLQALAQHNVELAEQYESVVNSMRKSEGTLNASKETREFWRSESENARNKVSSIGLTDAVGAMLRKQKLSLPSTRRMEANIKQRSGKIAEAQFELLGLQDERSSDLARTLRLDYDADIGDLGGRLREQAEQLIEKRNELLAPLILAQSGYFDTLVELSTVQEQTRLQIDAYRDFIDERILWVRSNKPLTSLTALRSERFNLARFDWKKFVSVAEQDASRHIVFYGFIGVFATLLLIMKQSLDRRVIELSELAAKRSCISYVPTLRTLIASILSASPLPLLMLFVGRRMYWAEGGDELIRSIGSGLYTVAWIYLPLAIIASILRKDGLAEAHFGWAATVVSELRRVVHRLMLLGLPLATVAIVMGKSAETLDNEIISRMAFIALMLLISHYAFRILSAERGVLREFANTPPEGWKRRLWPILCGVVVGIPIILALLSFWGYHFTARALSEKFRQSVGLGLAFVVTAAMLSRLLMVQRRKLSVEEARKKREAMMAKDDLSQKPIEFLSQEELQSQISQSRRLVRFAAAGVTVVCLWFVWHDILPALGFLEKWPLWQSSRQITEMVASDGEKASYVTRDVIDNVTIADLMCAIFVAITTVVATRNLPGTLELAVLKKLPIESSVRYAITALARYVIALAGIVIGFGIVGIHWKQVQWLATALTFGLAFGLQEMFANFVAGIIILFERPIRVGDIVTVDEVTGTVSKVRMRATTITNFDRKDYIVPNKDFITGRVLNWTLSDLVNRIVIKVGVAYGSDTQLALDTLMKVADDHPKIMDLPEPQATFEEFADSSLSFVLRVFIAMELMPHRLEIIHDLHMSIDQAFRQHNIEIAFPQRDIHIRSAVEPSGKLSA